MVDSDGEDPLLDEADLAAPAPATPRRNPSRKPATPATRQVMDHVAPPPLPYTPVPIPAGRVVPVFDFEHFPQALPPPLADLSPKYQQLSNMPARTLAAWLETEAFRQRQKAALAVGTANRLTALLDALLSVAPASADEELDVVDAINLALTGNDRPPNELGDWVFDVAEARAEARASKEERDEPEIGEDPVGEIVPESPSYSPLASDRLSPASVRSPRGSLAPSEATPTLQTLPTQDSSSAIPTSPLQPPLTVASPPKPLSPPPPSSLEAQPSTSQLPPAT